MLAVVAVSATLAGSPIPLDRARREAQPFAVDAGRLRALRMDMRSLEFPDESFDFAYSACAFEHIGEWADFVRHLREVHRVLRPGGV